MFCHQCGLELSPSAASCSGCGHGPSAAQGPQPLPPEPAGAPTLVLTPKFVPRLQVLGYLPFSLFLGLWCGGFFGGFSMVLFDVFDVTAPRWIPFLLFGALFTTLVPALLYRVQRRTYAQTRYTFHANKLDYYEGFFSVEEKSVLLANVTEVSLRRGGLQKTQGLGTIILSTPATSTSSGRARSGIHVADIEDPERVYARIKDLVEQAQQDAPQRLAA